MTADQKEWALTYAVHNITVTKRNMLLLRERLTGRDLKTEDMIINVERGRVRYREITGQDNAALAKIVRDNLRTHNLDLPGTVYFDDNLDHLSDFYLDEDHKRFYYVLLDDDGNVIGGIGFAEFEFFEDCAELQKLYLADDVKGSRIGYKLIELIENKAREYGYKRLYLETHTNLAAAIHIYEKCGFKVIEKPVGVVHATMNRFYIKDL